MTSENYKEIKELYLKGTSARKLSITYNTTIQTITNRLKKDKIPVINKWNLSKFNENIFDVIDSEEKAYWLGFLFADGNVASGKRNTIELSLSLIDTEHLKKFCKFMGDVDSNVKISSFRCRWSRGSKHLKEILMSYNCTPKKSLTLQRPQNLPKQYNLDFIRGYVDGDGCVFYHKSDYIGRHRLEILGTREILDFIQENLGKSKAKYKLNNNKNLITLVLSYGGIRTVSILDTIYKNATFYLNRKFEKYLKISRSLEKFNELSQSKNGEVHQNIG